MILEETPLFASWLPLLCRVAPYNFSLSGRFPFFLYPLPFPVQCILTVGVTCPRIRENPRFRKVALYPLNHVVPYLIDNRLNSGLRLPPLSLLLPIDIAGKAGRYRKTIIGKVHVLAFQCASLTWPAAVYHQKSHDRFIEFINVVIEYRLLIFHVEPRHFRLCGIYIGKFGQRNAGDLSIDTAIVHKAPEMVKNLLSGVWVWINVFAKILFKVNDVIIPYFTDIFCAEKFLLDLNI